MEGSQDTTLAPPVESVGEAEKSDRARRKEECIEAIKRHAEEVGWNSWNLVQEKFPDINVRSFWRYVQIVKGGGYQARGFTPEPENVRQGTMEIIKRAQAAATRENMPHPPSPSIIAAGGIEARRKLDFLTHINEMLADCEKLRAWSMRVDDATGGERVFNPLYFDKATQRRIEILNFGLNSLKTLWDIQKMQQLYQKIIDEVSKCDPETGRRIMERLQELDDDKGLTMNARVI